jgi:hypothetical protein
VKPVIREDGDGIVCQIQELFTENKILKVMSETIMATGVIYKHHPTKINISFPLKNSYFLYYSTSICMLKINYYVTESALYAPYSFLWISNMLCGGGKRVVTLAVVYDPVFRVIIYGPWISQASVT